MCSMGETPWVQLDHHGVFVVVTVLSSMDIPYSFYEGVDK